MRRPASALLLAAAALASASLAAADALGAASCERLRPSAAPYRHKECWPHALASASRPFLVHYREASERSMARRVRSLLEDAWTAEVDGMGFRSPLPDGGLAGPDDRLDVYLWRGIDVGYVAALAEVPATPEDDRSTYMVLDPWGSFGGALLASTVAHELNHACQAAYSWSEHPGFYEASATFAEVDATGSAALLDFVFRDFQSRPHWGLHRFDHYRTWYAYGAGLYLLFLRDRFFGGDAGFLADVWEGVIDSPGSDPRVDEPDFLDAIDAALARAAGTDVAAALPEFERWRWYTGMRDDGHHLRDAAVLPEVAARTLRLPADGRPVRRMVRPVPQILGASYVTLESTGGGAAAALVSLEMRGRPRARLVVEAVPGLDSSDAEPLASDAQPWRVALGPDGRRTLIVTALPLAGESVDANDRPRRGARALLEARLERAP